MGCWPNKNVKHVPLALGLGNGWRHKELGETVGEGSKEVRKSIQYVVV